MIFSQTTEKLTDVTREPELFLLSSDGEFFAFARLTGCRYGATETRDRCTLFFGLFSFMGIVTQFYYS
jgi:hypothetical protein